MSTVDERLLGLRRVQRRPRRVKREEIPLVQDREDPTIPLLSCTGEPMFPTLFTSWAPPSRGPPLHLREIGV